MNTLHRPSNAVADVALLLEGTYPFVAGGVSTWVHALLHAHRDLSFHLICLTPDDRALVPRYEVPSNVLSLTCIPLQSLPLGARRSPARMAGRVEDTVFQLERLLQGGASVDDLRHFASSADSIRSFAGRSLLLDSRAAFNAIRSAYARVGGHSSFLDFFWSWRSLASATLAVLLPNLPAAHCYHALSTGFAGLLGARLATECDRPLILTEHGIYTNERRIEIAMAEWLHRGPESSLATRKSVRDLRDLWIEAFQGFGALTYASANPVVTLYGGNQRMQVRDGALPERCILIPNGIDYERYAKISRLPISERSPTVALIGRVVPIKDIKTFIRAIGQLRAQIPNLRAEVLGPQDEDPDYARECANLIIQLGLQGTLTLRGAVSISDWLGRIDVNVLTSISEAQPLTILEAGAAGVPTIATDVGACREMLEGNPVGEDTLPAGGVITPVASPARTAAAIAEILLDRPRWTVMSQAIQDRVLQRYLKANCDRAYAELYGRAVTQSPVLQAA